jgi:VRR-NUC domain
MTTFASPAPSQRPTSTSGWGPSCCHTTGYLSLVEKYEFAIHSRKQQIVAQLLPHPVRGLLRDRSHGRAQAPDLLMYAEDFSDWFFCEVKGPRDRIRDEQVRKFGLLAEMTGKPVRLLEFWLTTGGGQ